MEEQMRKVELKMNEELKYQTIKKLVETGGNKKRAAIKLQCTVRSIDRMIAGYKEKGKEFLYMVIVAENLLMLYLNNKNLKLNSYIYLNTLIVIILCFLNYLPKEKIFLNPLENV